MDASPQLVVATLKKIMMRVAKYLLPSADELIYLLFQDSGGDAEEQGAATRTEREPGRGR